MQLKEDPDFDPDDFQIYLEEKSIGEEEEEGPRKKAKPKKAFEAKEPEDLVELRRLRMRKMYMIEALWWILPLVAIVLSRALWISTQESHQFYQALKTNLLEEDFPYEAAHVKKNFFDVANSEEMYQWMDNIFFEAVDWDNGGFIADNQKLVGGFAVRTNRVTNDSCKVYPQYVTKDIPPLCYSWWSSKAEAKTVYGGSNSDLWFWSPSVGWGANTVAFGGETLHASVSELRMSV